MSVEDKRQAAELLQKGNVQHRAGQIGVAQSHYQRAAKLDPDNPNVWHLLGICALQANNLPLAVKHFRSAVKLHAGFAEAYNNLGIALRRMHKHDDAFEAFQGALRVRPRYVEAVYNLAMAHEAAGKPADAEQAYRQALEWRSTDFNAANNLGNLLRRQGRFADGLPWLQLAQRLQPESGQANGNLALLLIDMGRFRDAVTYANSAVLLDAKTADWWRALGVAQRLQKNVQPAIAALRKAVELAPQDDIALSELGVTLGEAGLIEEARDVLARVKPPERHKQRIRWALALSLPSVYRSESDVDAERERFSRGLEELIQGTPLDTLIQRLSAYDAACGVATFLLHYQDRDNTALQNRFGDLVTRVMTAVAPQWMAPCSWKPLAHGGRIRVGIVSAHLMNHTVSRYFKSMLAGLPADKFDVHVWYSGEQRDYVTEYIASRVSSFSQVNEDALISADKIRAAQLDVLIYPETGMDPRHHVLGSLRLAPIQCVMYGHPATSGLPAMDYFLSGDVLEPLDGHAHYRENLVRLPGFGANPLPPPMPGDGAWVDAYAKNGPLLLCLQNHLKLAPAFDDTLATIVARTGARIGFFIRNPVVGQRFRDRIEQTFSRRGLNPERALAFLPTQTHASYLGAIARSPLVLDSTGFSGGGTSLDAFSVGTPVLAWQGAMARGRQTSGMLSMMGIDELIAQDEAQYIDKAVALAGDSDRSGSLRARILDRKQVLFEGADVIAAFARFIEDVVTRGAA